MSSAKEKTALEPPEPVIAHIVPDRDYKKFKIFLDKGQYSRIRCLKRRRIEGGK
jgi:hypothetical protein